MAGGLFAILDDIAVLLDDAAVMTKIAAKKTAGVLGDDLAVNAEKASGFHASRELPVLWAISKGSILNKLIILPLAFLLSAFLPGLIVPILLIGGLYLSFEGAEKMWEWFFPHPQQAEHQAEVRQATHDTIVDLERQKIRSAIITDFILSIEIIIIALGSVIEQRLMLQLIVVSLVALIATVGVYGFVALLVRMDDIGFWLMQRAQLLQGRIQALLHWIGALLVRLMPVVIKALSVIGTVAMLLVGGGIFVHHLEFVHHGLAFMPTLAAELCAGLLAGGLVFALVETGRHLFAAKSS